MKRIKKVLVGCLFLICTTFTIHTTAYADRVGDAGGTDQGNIGGTNVYTFSYSYDSSDDAIKLTVTTTRAINSFGGTKSHTFNSPSDQTVLNTQNPRLGSSLESAIATMNAVGGYNLSVDSAKAALNGLGYYDGGNGIWRRSGGYLTYVSAVKIRPQKHTVHYNANGGSGAPGDQQKTYGSAMWISNQTPSRYGYNFGGWSCSFGGTYQPGQSYTHDQDGGTVTMTAIWNAWRHTIHYDANGGSGAPGNQTKVYGTALTLSRTKPTRTGYTFKGWTCNLGGTYQPGGSYTHDQNGGTVTMTAKWVDETPPDCGDFVAIPNYWSAGNGTVTFNAQDQGSGLSYIVLQRYSYVSNSWSTVKTWSYSGTTSRVYGSYTETAEGVFYYKLTITDKARNSTTRTSATIYLDHSNPVLSGVQNTVTEWTNIAPVIRFSATDYLSGTSYTGSGLSSVVIKDDNGNMVGQGISSAVYTLEPKYEGIHTWYITATDRVGHTSSARVTTKYDITAPGIDGTEVAFVYQGRTVSGYCQDNIINQHTDDEASRSINRPNATSGLKSVQLYKVKNGVRTAISTSQTVASFGGPDTHTKFDIYYDINLAEDIVDHYLIVVQDYAGNVTTKKLTSQRSLLTWFHTSIDRSTYE